MQPVSNLQGDQADVSKKKLPTSDFKDESCCSKEEVSLGVSEMSGFSEDHFAQPEELFKTCTMEEVKTAIDKCKQLILSSADLSEKKILVRKLIQLKVTLQEFLEAPAQPPDQQRRSFLGHSFEPRSLERPHKYCEWCCSIIWGVLANWFHCVYCGFKCHSKCLNLIVRTCASVKVSEICVYELRICPIAGLSQQKFRCAECRRKFILKNDLCLPRLCDYTGLYYCSRCHWNSLSTVPARVVHNWDFTSQKVSRASLQFLRLMIRKPILDLESLNPTLFALVPDLGSIKKLRNDILMMKRYFLSCHSALKERLLLQLQEKPHFVEGAHLYSLQDLVDVSSGSLLIYLEKVHALFVGHITAQCQSCRGKGFICELCKSDDVIFPFDPRTEMCRTCSSVFHQECFLRWRDPCPKCVRRKKSIPALPS